MKCRSNRKDPLFSGNRFNRNDPAVACVAIFSVSHKICACHILSLILAFYWELCGQAHRQYLRSSSWKEDDGVHWWCQHASHQWVGRSGNLLVSVHGELWKLRLVVFLCVESLHALHQWSSICGFYKLKNNMLGTVFIHPFLPVFLHFLRIAQPLFFCCLSRWQMRLSASWWRPAASTVWTSLVISQTSWTSSSFVPWTIQVVDETTFPADWRGSMPFSTAHCLQTLPSTRSLVRRRAHMLITPLHFYLCRKFRSMKLLSESSYQTFNWLFLRFLCSYTFVIFQKIGSIVKFLWLFFDFCSLPGCIATGYFCKQRGFGADVINLASQLVHCTRIVWQKTKVSSPCVCLGIEDGSCLKNRPRSFLS